MALVVEDGTAKANADSYISVTDATARNLALGNAIWASMTNAEMEEALRRATTFMVQAYRQRWIGTRRTTTQSLDWPRTGVVIGGYTNIASDTVPLDIALACADMALKAAAADLNADLARGVVREKVGPIETEYDPHSPQKVRYPSIEMALAPYLNGSMARVVRA